MIIKLIQNISLKSQKGIFLNSKRGQQQKHTKEQKKKKKRIIFKIKYVFVYKLYKNVITNLFEGPQFSISNLNGGENSKLSDPEAVDKLHDVNAEVVPADKPEKSGAKEISKLYTKSVQLPDHGKCVKTFTTLKKI